MSIVPQNRSSKVARRACLGRERLDLVREPIPSSGTPGRSHGSRSRERPISFARAMKRGHVPCRRPLRFGTRAWHDTGSSSIRRHRDATCPPSIELWKLPAASCPLRIAIQPLRIASLAMRMSSRSLSIVTRPLSIAPRKLRGAACTLRITVRKRPIAAHTLRIAVRKRPIAAYTLRITVRERPIAARTLRITVRSLPSWRRFPPGFGLPASTRPRPSQTYLLRGWSNGGSNSEGYTTPTR